MPVHPMTKICAELRRPFILVANPGPDQPGDACSREDPHQAQQNQERAEDRAVHHQRGETVSLGWSGESPEAEVR